MKKLIRVRDVMRDHFLLMDGLATVREVLHAMREDNASAVIVKKRHDDDEFGIVLLSDIAKKVLAIDRSPDRVNIYEIMSKPVIGIDPDMDVRYCSRLFEQFGLSHAPVIEEGNILGMVDYHAMVLRGLAEL
jgi:signal-transduction protein with cAMP-binding, CBS, and nucleotidyltransferase domain